VLRDLGEEICAAPRHGDVVQRAHLPHRVEAHRHQKAAPGIRDFLERHLHSRLVIAINFGPNSRSAAYEVAPADPRLHAFSLMSPMVMAMLFREVFGGVSANPPDLQALADQHAARRCAVC
jgi:hypothetical protein